jgi:hypothetical protein
MSVRTALHQASGSVGNSSKVLEENGGRQFGLLKLLVRIRSLQVKSLEEEDEVNNPNQLSNTMSKDLKNQPGIESRWSQKPNGT